MAANMLLMSRCVLLVIAVAAAAAAPPGEGTAVPAKTHPEDQCVHAGGTCLPEKECPTGQLSPIKGLCPLQQHAGVECCHGISMLERRCSMRGGECTPKSRCGRQLWDAHAEDCRKNEACCILV